MNKLAKKILHSAREAVVRLESRYDARYLAQDVPLSPHITPLDLIGYLSPAAPKRLRILEIGSREVTGISSARDQFATHDYVGFDFYPGRNVDVVGDVHTLSSYFEPGEQFDIIYSIACFEHFAMPWVVATEIARMLKLGGILFVKTHFSYSAHERPWNFFQFSDMGLRVLFSPALGFDMIESGMSNPMVGRFSAFASEDLRLKPIPFLYCGSEYLGRKIESVTTFDWAKLQVADVVAGTKYPEISGIDLEAQIAEKH